VFGVQGMELILRDREGIHRVPLHDAGWATGPVLCDVQALYSNDHRPLQLQSVLPGGCLAKYALPRARVCRDDLTIGGGHNACDTRAATQKKTCRRYYHKHQQQGVFDKVLSLIIVPKVVKGSQFIPTSLSASSRALHPRNPVALSIAAAHGKCHRPYRYESPGAFGLSAPMVRFGRKRRFRPSGLHARQAAALSRDHFLATGRGGPEGHKYQVAEELGQPKTSVGAQTLRGFSCGNHTPSSSYRGW
jgi:hypothetical protein